LVIVGQHQNLARRYLWSATGAGESLTWGYRATSDISHLIDGFAQKAGSRGESATITWL
jgi:hypothetical protein